MPAFFPPRVEKVIYVGPRYPVPFIEYKSRFTCILKFLNKCPLKVDLKGARPFSEGWGNNLT